MDTWREGIMAGVLKLIYTQEFVNTDIIEIIHNSGYEYLKIKVITEVLYSSNIIKSVITHKSDPTNILTVILESPQTGSVQLFAKDTVNISESSATKLHTVSDVVEDYIVTVSGSLQNDIDEKPTLLTELNDTPSTYDSGKYLQSTTAGSFWAMIAGIPGEKGADGGEWMSGHGAPTLATGTLNNFYLDIDTGNVYKKTSVTSGTSQYGVMIEREADYSYTFVDAIRLVKTGKEQIIDNLDEEFYVTGSWYQFNNANAWEASCRYTTTLGSKAYFDINIEENGEYDIYAWWPVYVSAGQNVPFEITHVSGTNVIRKDQHAGSPQWNYLATYSFDGEPVWEYVMTIKGADGETTFSGLSDTPDGYDDGKYAKSTNNGIEWFDLTDDFYTESEIDTISGSLNSELNDHISNTGNPHSVTLEQARAEDNIITGSIVFNPTSNLTCIDMSAANRDLTWMLGHNTDGYGYYWQYTGTGSGDANYLYLYSENGAGADFYHLRYHQTTHVIDVGSRLNIDNDYAVQFRDSAIYISSVDDGHLDLNADTSIDLNADTDLTNHNLNNTQRISFEQRTSDVSLVDDGDVWYRNDTENYKVSANSLIHEVQLVKIIQCYNNTTTNCNVTTPVTIPFNGEDFKDDLYTHDLVTNNGRIEVERTGIYKIIYQLNFDNVSNSRTTIRSRIRVNGATYLDRGTAYSYMRSTTDDKITNNASILWELSANDYIEIMCDRQGSSGTANTIPNQSSITLNIIRYT